MTDQRTKALLLAIALGLWANTLGGWLHPTPVMAQDNDAVVYELGRVRSSLDDIRSELTSIQSDVSSIKREVTDIGDGTCTNRKLC